MRRLASLAALAAVLLVALFLVVACGSPPLPPEVEPVPHPPLDELGGAAREQLGAARERFESALGDWNGEPRRLANAFGSLGELYHAYRLLDPAAVAYRNAARLDPASFAWPYVLGVVEAERGRFAAAAEAFGAALALSPDNGPLRLRLGELALATGDAAAAGPHFRAALAADAELAAAAHYGLGRASAAAGEHATAVEHLERALELQPAAGVIHHALGRSLARLGRSAESRQHLEADASGEVLYPDPPIERIAGLARSGGALLARGNRALVSGDLEAARELFREAVAAAPDNVAAQRNLAHAELRLGDAAGAAETLERAVAAHPEEVWLHFDLGSARLAAGEGAAAIAAFERTLELAPDLTQARFNLANALGGAGRWEEALRHLERVVSETPDDLRARYLLAMALHATGSSAVAEERLRALLAESPGDGPVRDGLAKVLIESGRRSEAEALWVDALAGELADEERLDLLHRLAELRWQLGRRDDAIATFERAAELYPDSSRAHTSLANVLQLTGRRREAIEHFQRAVDLDPKNATAWLSESTLWILEGEHARARQRLEQALAYVPGDPELMHTLARLLATAPEASVRDGRLAADLARRVYSLQPTPAHGDTLGMAMAEMGNFEEAIRWTQRLISEAAARQDRGAAAPLVEHLRLYQQRRPVRLGTGG